MNNVIKTACLAILTIFLCWLISEAHGVLVDARSSLKKIDPVLENASATLASANATIAEGKTAFANLNAIAGAETDQVKAITLEARKTEAASRLLIIRTNESLNGGPDTMGVLPQLTSAITRVNLTTRQIGDSVTRVTDGFAPAIANLNRASASAADTLADPAIRQSIAQLNTATAGVADSTRQLDASMTDVRQMADKARETYTKPVNLWWAMLKQLISTGGSMAQMVK